jgi:two-component system, cell cycle sensor histidine kinase and response regulator CckA
LEPKGLGEPVPARRADRRRDRPSRARLKAFTGGNQPQDIDFRKLLEHLPVVTYVLRADDGTPLYTSSQDTEVFGYLHQDYLENPDVDLELIHPQDRDRVRTAWEHSRASGEPFADEYRVYDRHGELRWFSEKASVVCDESGEPLYLFGVMMDISDQKRAEAALKSSEQRFKAVFFNAAIGVALVDQSGMIIESNPAFQDLVGYSGEELREMRIADVTHPEDYPENLRLFKDLMEGNLESYQYEKRYIRKDRTICWGNLTTSLIRDSSGKPQLCLALIENVTERKALEDQLRQSQKMQAVGRLAGGVAHDFNNLLAVIQNCARFVAEGLEPGDPLRDDAQEIVRAGDRAATLIRQLLAFSRKEVVHPEVLDLNDVVDEMEKLLRRTIGEDIKLQTRLDSELWSVKADRGRLEQVVANLAVNARDAMPEGGTVAIETANVLVTSERSRSHLGLSPGRWVRLRFSDTGLGMSSEVMRHVFEPFFTTKLPGEGTGLGLSTVYGIVEGSGGRIFVESVEGGGTSFDIYLPVTEDASRAPDGDAKGSSRPGEGEVVLLAEDDDGVREIVRRILERNGYHVIAGGPLEALSIFAHPSAAIDVLVTDIVMPGLSGTELVTTLRAERPNLPVVYISGYTAEFASRQELESQDVFVSKPFTELELTSAVRSALDGSRLRR